MFSRELKRRKKVTRDIFLGLGFDVISVWRLKVFITSFCAAVTPFVFSSADSNKKRIIARACESKSKSINGKSAESSSPLLIVHAPFRRSCELTNCEHFNLTSRFAGLQLCFLSILGS